MEKCFISNIICSNFVSVLEKRLNFTFSNPEFTFCWICWYDLELHSLSPLTSERNRPSAIPRELLCWLYSQRDEKIWWEIGWEILVMIMLQFRQSTPVLPHGGRFLCWHVWEKCSWGSETGTVFPLASEALELEFGVELFSYHYSSYSGNPPACIGYYKNIGSHFDHHNNDLLFSPPGFCLLDLTEQFALPETSPPMLARILEAIEKKGELWPRELQVTHLDMKLEFQLFLLTLTVC